MTTSVTTNEQHVRFRIFEGDLQVSEAGAELLRLEREQHAATRARLKKAYELNSVLLSRLAGL